MASPPWTRIDTVLLDMDGTLPRPAFRQPFLARTPAGALDALHGCEPAAAREELLARYREVEARWPGYCVEHWSRALAVDVVELKREVEHLIASCRIRSISLAALRQPASASCSRPTPIRTVWR